MQGGGVIFFLFYKASLVNFFSINRIPHYFIFDIQGWMGGVKMKAIVPFDRVVFLLSKQNAPRQVFIKNIFKKKIINNDKNRLLPIQKYVLMLLFICLFFFYNR